MAKLTDIVKKSFRRAMLPLVLVSGMAFGQSYNVHGTIRDMNGQTPGSALQNVKVEADSGTKRVFTDVNGNYSLSLPFGNHNLRVVKSDKRGWQQNYSINSDTTLNFSLPDTVQNVPMGSATLKTFDIKESYGLSSVNLIPWFWKNLPVPIFLSNATSLDSLTFKQYVSSGTGDWTKADSGSAEWAMQRPLFILTSDQNYASNNGMILNCQGNTNNTSINGEIQNAKYTGYIQNGGSTVGASDPVAFQHELLGFGFSKTYVFSRPSNMNNNITFAPTWTNIDNLITWVGENYKLARLRGDNNTQLFSMLDYYPSVMVKPATLADSQSLNNNLVNVMLSWSPVFDADYYSVQVATDSNFTNVVFNGSNILQNAQSLSLNPATKYFFKVNARNNTGTSPSSDIFSFTTVVPVPSSPSIVQPSNNSVNQPISEIVKWNSVPFAVNYHLQFGKDSTFATTDSDTIMVDTLKAFANLQNSKKYFIRLSASNSSGTSAPTNSNFTTIVALPGLPVLLAPANYASNQPVNLTLSWTPGSNASNNEIQFASDSTFASVLKDTTLSNSSLALSNLQNLQNYSWRVKSNNVAGSSNWATSHFTTIVQIPVAPSIVQPSNNSTNQPVNEIVKWNSVPFAVNYHLQFGKDSTFATTDLDTMMVDTSKAFSNLQNSKKYFIRLSASNSSGTSSQANSNFTTIPSIPAAPVIAVPANGSVNQSTSLTAKWSSVPFAANYHLQFGRDSTFATSDLDTLIVDTLKAINNLQNNQKYFMRVNAGNVAGSSNWSNANNFTTIIALPGLPVLISPANYSTNQPVNLTLSWTLGSNASSSEIQFASDSTFASVLKDTTLSADTLALQNLQNLKNYSWRVKSNNVAGSSNWATSHFTTIRPPTTAYVALALRDTTVHKNIALVVLSSNVKNNIKGDKMKNYSASTSFGTAIIRNDSLIFTPNYGFTGLAPVTLLGTDSSNNTASTTSHTQINNTLPTAVVLNPLAKDTIQYNNIQIPVSWKKSSDIDGDTLTYSAHFFGNSFDTTATTKDTIVYIPSKMLKPSSSYTIKVSVNDGTANVAGLDSLLLNTASQLTGVFDNNPNVPGKYELMQNYPNPYNPSTKISFKIPHKSQVHLEVYNMLGQKVSTLVDKELSAGEYTVTFPDMGQYQKLLPSGVYLYRLDAGDFHQTKKMIQLK